MEVKDEVLREDDEKTIYSTYPPIGVCAGIVPWNWPILLGLGKLGPALITGNTFIMKPSPYTPYCDLKLGELAAQVFPPGVVQVLSGDDNLGPWITEHPGIDKIAFTGSIATGKLVAASCAKTLKRYVLELGGNDAAIVCEDVDIDKCLPKIAMMSFLNSGQICMLTKRIYIHEKIYDEFRDRMVEFTKGNIKTGAGTEEGVVVGPVQNKMQYVVQSARIETSLTMPGLTRSKTCTLRSRGVTGRLRCLDLLATSNMATSLPRRSSTTRPRTLVSFKRSPLVLLCLC